MRRFFLLFSALAVTGIVWSLFASENINDLKGDFKQVALSRNENNTGPVQRVYIVSLTDTLWKEMKTYGDYLPYSKYGNTTVYFFLAGTSMPTEVSWQSPTVPASFQPFCIGKFEKDESGIPMLYQYPFR